jgi:hypothetical protein
VLQQIISKVIFTVVVFVSVANVSFGSAITFSSDNPIVGTLISTHTVLLYDIDSDGDNDSLVTAANSSAVVWLENNGGNGTNWIAHLIATDLVGALAAVATDLDGDGDLDVVAGGEVGLVWFENDGTPGDAAPWTRRTINSAFTTIFAITRGDFDRDGDDDVAATSFGSDAVIWCVNDGSPANDVVWTTVTVQSSAGDPRSIDAADIDRDGDLDLVVAGVADGTSSWYENNGSPGTGSTWTRRTVDTLSDLASCAVGDIDGDGDLDVVGLQSISGIVSWWENTSGNGSTWLQQNIDTTLDGPATAAATDLDQDGDTDIVVGTEVFPPNAANNDDIVVWYENLGSPGSGTSWTRATIDSKIDRALGVVAGDIDKDGDIDVAGVQAGAGVNFQDGDVLWWRNESIHGNASFVRKHSVDEAFLGARDVKAVDINRDGQPDLIAAGRDAGAIRLWRSDGSPQDDLGGDGNSWTQITVDNAFGGAISVAVADIDHNGNPDIVAAGFTANKVSWWKNTNGDGTVWTLTNISTSISNPSSVFPADVDLDGDMDVVATASGGNAVVWFENTSGTGSAWAPHNIDTSLTGAASCGVADVNRDGFPDVVACGATSNTVALYRGNGGASWTKVPVGSSFTGARSVTLADIDMDGDIDIVGGAETSGEVALFLNSNNGGTWTKSSVSTSETGVRSVVVGDTDNDGDIDIYAAASGINSVVYFSNRTGSGTQWDRLVVDPAISGASGVGLGDIDRNGLLDIAVAGQAGGTLHWLENRGGQIQLATTNLSTGAILQGNTAAMLRIVAKHNGRAADNDAEVVTFELLFEEQTGDVLTSGEANALVQDMFIYLDANTNNTFELGSDTLVLTTSTLALTSGRQTVSFTDGAQNTRVAFDSPKTYFAVVTLTGNASAQVPKTFQITHITEASSTAQDFLTDKPIRIEFAPNAASANTIAGNLIAPQVASAVATGPNSVTVTYTKQMLNDAQLTNAGNYVFTGGVVAQTVTRTGATTVSVTTTEMIQGQGYTVTVSTNGPRDQEGNFVAAGFNSANFAGVGTPPTVLDATALNSTTVRVTYSENMLNNAALVNILNYTITKSGGGNLTVLSASRVNATTVNLTTAEMQNAINYTVAVTVGGPADLAGNFVSGVANSDTFAGIGVKPTVVSAVATSTTTVTVTFSENMAANAALSLAANYTFNNGLATSSVSVVNGSTIQLTTNSIVTDTVYTLTVSTTGPTDSAGNTVAAGSNTAQFVLPSANPQVLSAAVQSSTVVRVTFNKAMQNNAALTTAGNYTFGGGALSASSVAVFSTTAVDITLAQEMQQGQPYTVIVSTSGPQDTLANFVSANANTAGFVGNGDAPGIAAIVAISSTSVQLDYDEAMLSDAALVSAGSYSFDNSLAVVNVLRINATRVVITTSEMLQGQSYNITISTSGPVDLAGNFVSSISNGNTAAFSGIGTKPQVLSASPTSTTKVRVVFNEPMRNDASLTTAANYTFNNGLAAQSALRVDSTTIDITTNAIVGGTLYTLTVSTAGGGPKDLAGNTVAAGSNTAQFTGIGQNPQVQSASAIDSNTVDIVFSEEMQNNAALIDLNKYTFNNGLISNGVTRINATKVRVATTEMKDGQSYTVTVSTSGIIDLDGNSLANPTNSATFTGIGDSPIVVSAGATALNKVRVVFSEELTNNVFLTDDANYLFDNGLDALSVTQFNALTVEITTTAMTPDQDYVVTVVSSASGGPTDLAGNPVSASLNTANFTGLGSSPQVVAALPIGSNLVRVFFSEAMLNDAALVLAGNYVFDNGLTTVSVSVNDATSVDVTASEMVTNVLYTVVVATPGGPTDLGSNPLLAGSNSISFLGSGANPIVQSVTALSSTSIEVVFSESMSNDAGLTSLGNYSMTGGLSGLAVVPTNATTVQIAVVEMKEGEAYTLTVSTTGPVDLVGNSVSILGNTGDFTGLGEAPTISLVGNSTVTVIQDNSYVDAGAIASDNFDGDLTASLQVTSDVDTSIPGTYEVTYNVSDAAGNAAIPVTRTVIVKTFGDLNGDDDVNAVDIQLVINSALGLDISPFDADVNGDDSVNAVDVQLVINAALGL